MGASTVNIDIGEKQARRWNFPVKGTFAIRKRLRRSNSRVSLFLAVNIDNQEEEGLT